MHGNNNFEQTFNVYLTVWAADTIAPAGMHILCIAQRYNKPNNLVSLFIDSGTDLVSPLWFVLALALNSENNFIIVKLMIWVWCGVAIMNQRI